MLTVKLIEPRGHEQIHEVRKVWTVPPEGDSPDNATSVFAENATGDVFQFATYGTLYVMNDHGSTIAKYYLGAGFVKDKAA